MALKATPLSFNWLVKDVIDEVRAVTKEEDEQISSDDNIRAHLDWAIQNMYKVTPDFKYAYIVDVPFVVDTTADPLVSTLRRPFNSATAKPIKIERVPTIGAFPILGSNGLYDYHYEHPENFVILGWYDVWNELTGTCRRSTDISNLMGHSLNNNSQLARTVAWYSAGQQLWISVREAMINRDRTSDVIIHGFGFRTPLRLIQYVNPQPTAPTAAAEDFTPSPPDERFRMIPIQNDWDKIDCPDDYVPLAVNLALIKVWSQVGKISKEQESAAIEQAYGTFFESTEQHLAQREVYRKDNQYKDRGHQ